MANQKAQIKNIDRRFHKFDLNFSQNKTRVHKWGFTNQIKIIGILKVKRHFETQVLQQKVLLNQVFVRIPLLATFGFGKMVLGFLQIKKGEQIKSYLTQHPRITATAPTHSHTSMFKNYLSALGPFINNINKVYQVLVCIHLITILIQKVMIQCVISAVPRCVLNRLKVTRFKIQPRSI